MGRALKSERVQGLTGEVHLRPIPVLMRFSSPEGFHAEERSIVYLLDYLGEGFGHVWSNGKIVEAQIMDVMENCPFPGRSCWGEFVNPEDAGRQRDAVWWVQVKTPSGIVGWTKHADHFGEVDGCG